MILVGISLLIIIVTFFTSIFNHQVSAQECAGDTMDCGTPQLICTLPNGAPCYEGDDNCTCEYNCLMSSTITCVYTPYMRCNDQCFSGCVVSGSCSWSGPTQAPAPTSPPVTPIPTAPPGCVYNCGDGLCCTPDGENQSNCPADCGAPTEWCWHCEGTSCVEGPPNGAECNCLNCMWSTFTALVFVDLNEDGVWSGDDIDARVVTDPAHVGDAYDLGVLDVYIPGLQLANTHLSTTAVGNAANADFDPGDYCEENVWVCMREEDVFGDVWRIDEMVYLSNSCYGRTRCCGKTDNCWGGPADCKSGQYVSAGKLDLIRGRFNSHAAIIPYYTNTSYWLVNLDTNQWEVVGAKPTQRAQGCDTDNAWFALRYKNDPPIIESAYISSINGDTSTTDQMCLTGSSTNELEIISFFSDPDEPISQNLVTNGSFENGTTSWTLQNINGNTDGSASIVTGNDAYYGSSAIRVNGGTSTGYFRAIQAVNLEPSTSYSFTATYKSGTTGTNPRLGAHVYCHPSDGSPAISQPTMSITFNSLYSEFATVTHSFSTITCDGQFTIYIFSDTDPNSWMILDGVFLRQNSQVAEIYSDISRFQVNIEKQNFPAVTAYNANDWPVRLGAVRGNFSVGATTYNNRYRAFDGNLLSDNHSPLSYDFVTNRWYLSSYLYIDPAQCLPWCNPSATLLPSNPATSDWNTYFQPVSGYTDTIFARWIVNIENQFPQGNYHLTGWIRDFRDQQDTRNSAGNRTKMTLTAGASTFTWQRFGTLETILPSLTVNFVESEVGDDPSGDYCPYRAGGTAVTLNGATVGVRPSGGSTFQNSSINGISTIDISSNACSDTYDVRLTLNPSDGYVCDCQIGSNPYECVYYDVPATYLGFDPINFYLLEVDLTNEAWFQSVGGEISALGSIRSNIPYNSATSGPCNQGSNCWPALITWLPWSGGEDYVNTPGFPFARTGGSINTHADGGTAYIHTTDQHTQSNDGHAFDNSAIPTEYNYQYFYNRFGFEYDSAENELASGAQPALSSGLNIRFAQTGLNITEPWQVSSGQQLIVFVNGNLSIDDSVGDRRMIQVDSGGYLAFIVLGNITINSNVGYSVPNTNPIVFARPGSVSPNVEGIYIADGTLTIANNGNASLPDKKFIGAGTFVGWSGVNLARTFDDGVIGMAWHNFNPTETFIYRPDFLLNAPSVMKEPIHEWREVAPRTSN